MTISRYSLGTTIVPSPERLNCSISPTRSRWSAALRRGLERAEGLVHRPVVGPEDFQPMRRRAVAEHEVALRRLDRGRVRLEQLGDPRAGAPERGRPGAGRRRRVLADGLEELPDEAFGRPVGKADPAAALADANQLGRGAVLVGGEHHPEGRDDRVEALVRERQRFRVGLAELDVEPFGRGALAGALEQRRHVVGGDHVAPATGGGEGRVAVAGSDVEHLLSRAEIEGLAQFLADDLQGGADDGIIARRPRRLLAGLERLEVGLADGLTVLTGGGGGGRVHVPSPFGCGVSAP